MSANASIVLTAQDNMSDAILGIRNAVTPFRRDLDALQDELSMLNRSRYSMRLDLDRAQNELRTTREAFRALGDSATDAEREVAQADFHEAVQNYENIRTQLNLISRQARQTERDMTDSTGAISRADNRASRAEGQQPTGARAMLSGLGQAGLIQMGGDAAATWANLLVGSSFGQDAGSLFSGALSGAASGAAMGSLLGPVGTAVGAVGGAAVGLVNGGAQIYERKNDAFKAVVQEATEAQLNAMQEDIQSGSAVAAQREQDANAFNTLLGEGRGDAYLQDVRATAAKTPLEYDDLTGMSRALAPAFKEDTDRMLALMTGLGNAGSAVGIDISGMEEMARSLARLQSSGKANLEYLNIFQDRGVDAVGMLADKFGTSKDQMYDMISKGKIDGLAAVDAIQAGIDQLYSGAMEKQSQTFTGLSSTLQDAQTEMQNAYGEGFNTERKKGIQEEIDSLSGAMGDQQKEMNSAMGTFVASLENEKERMVREAMAAVMESEEYQSAKATGTDEGMVEAGRLLMEAKANAMLAYNATEGAQLMVQMELQLAGTIRDNAQSNEAYWNAGVVKGKQYSKGFTYGAGTLTPGLPESGGSKEGPASYGPKAFGLTRVPYDNYSALLHEGERVLTASEARSYNHSGSQTIRISGNQFSVREEADIDRIALALADMIELARLGGAG